MEQSSQQRKCTSVATSDMLHAVARCQLRKPFRSGQQRRASSDTTT